MPVAKPLEKDHPSVEQILAHLDHMRSACKDISCMQLLWFLLCCFIFITVVFFGTFCRKLRKIFYGTILKLSSIFV